MNELIQKFLARLKADKRVRAFQGMHVNTDGSVSVIDQHGQHFFKSFMEMDAWLNDPTKP